MQPQSVTAVIFGQTIYIYGLYLSAACLLAACLLLMSVKGEQRRNAAALTCLLSPVLGLFMARLTYVVFEVNFAPFLSLQNAFNLRLGGLSMFGALTGAVLGAVLSAALSGVRCTEWLDIITPPAFLFVALARLGEQYTTLGISRPLVTGVLDNTFLAFTDTYNAYLRTYLLESMGAFILCIASIIYRKKNRRAGRTFLFGALLFGVSQTLFESLRFDAHIRFSFIGLHQVLSASLFSFVLIYLSVDRIRHHAKKLLPVLTLVMIPLILGSIIGVEFMIDRSHINKWISYAIYIAVLAIPSALGLSMLEKERVY